MSNDLTAKKEQAYNIIGNYLEAMGIEDKVHPMSFMSEERKIFRTKGIEDKIKPSILDLYAQNTTGRYEGVIQNLKNVQAHLQRDGGIVSEVLDSKKPGQGEVTRLLIDSDQPGFQEKLQKLFDKSKDKLIANALAAQAENVKIVMEITRDGIPLGMDGKPISPQQAADFIAEQVKQLNEKAAEMGVSKMVEAKLSPRTGRSLSKGDRSSATSLTNGLVA